MFVHLCCANLSKWTLSEMKYPYALEYTTDLALYVKSSVHMSVEVFHGLKSIMDHILAPRWS
jgi:hypothetical protein